MNAMPNWTSSPPVPVVPRPPKPERKPVDLSTPALQQLQSALDAIPQETKPLDYDDWRNVIFAIHYATEGAGLEMAHAFSARSAKYEPEFLDERVWPYIGISSADPVTERTLFALAATHGWQDPTLIDDFDVVEAEPEDDFEALPESEDGRPLFTPIRAADFAAGKPMDWIIKGVMPRADIGMVFGASGSGKSFLLIDICGAVARGVEWRGKAVKKGRICYVVAEGAAGFRKRLDAYCIQNNVDITDLDIYVIPDAPNLAHKAHVKALCAAVKAAGPFDLLVLDTLAAVSSGADENSAKDMGVILDNARAVGRAAKAMTLIVHHAGKQADRGARGSTALKGRVDVEIEVVRSDNDRAATVSKLRDREDGQSFGFKLEVVPVGMDDEGEVIDSCVIAHVEGAPMVGQRGGKLQGKNDIETHKIILDLIDMDGQVLLSEVQAEYSVRVPLDASKTRDTRDQICKRSVESIARKGLIDFNGVRISVDVGGQS